MEVNRNIFTSTKDKKVVIEIQKCKILLCLKL